MNFYYYFLNLTTNISNAHIQYTLPFTSPLSADYERGVFKIQKPKPRQQVQGPLPPRAQ